MRLVAISLGLACLAAPASAQVVTEMTPEAIAQAIELGRLSAEGIRAGGRDFVRVPGMCAFGCTEAALKIRTPFMRVALASAEAALKHLPFTPAHVTEEMRAPVLDIRQNGFLVGRRPINYMHIVAASGSTPPTFVQPLFVEKITSRFENAFGATYEAHGVHALFPLSVLAEGYEFRLVRDTGEEMAEPLTSKMLAEIR